MFLRLAPNKRARHIPAGLRPNPCDIFKSMLLVRH